MTKQTSLPNFDLGQHGLLPAIAQDAESGDVLMMAWMNREVWQETLTTGRVVYWSRSRGQPWRKGEKSGHIQLLVSARIDCDGDTILLQVTQEGAACHDGFRSCFYRRFEPNGNVKIAAERLVDPEQVYGAADGSST